MRKTVIAIGLDAAEPALLEKWMNAGLLPNLLSVREKGAYAKLQNEDYYRAETPWTTFLTGVSPQTTGYWGPVKYRSNYSVEDIQAYSFDNYKPFYSLDKNRRVATFDVPQTCLSEALGGYQIIGWGSHSTQAESQSIPSGLLNELIDRYGEHPAFGNDIARVYDFDDVTRLYEEMLVGIERRASICKDLLQREELDLFLTIFGESHAAGHFFWHLHNEDHPMHEHYKGDGRDYLLSTFQAIDRAIGEILDAAPSDASILIFSAHGMQSNNMDVPSTFFLPELLYRWSFSGSQAFPSSSNQPPISQSSNFLNNEKWYKGIWTSYSQLNIVSRAWAKLAPTPAQRAWALLVEKLGLSNNEDIISPYQYKNEGGKFDWQPSAWYKPSWPKMKAFSLPSFSEGYIRINLEGRESSGIVSENEYTEVCDEIETFLLELVNAKTGKAVVERVIRTRTPSTLCDPKRPDADLIVIWNAEAVTDCVESSHLGRVGPAAFQRSGSHTSNGFVISKLSTTKPNSSLPACHATDLAPSILGLMDVEIPDYMEGKDIFSSPVLVNS